MRPALVGAIVLLAGATPRLLLAGGLLPDRLQAFVWSDVLFTWERGLSGGRLPYWDSYFEYPPLAGYVSGIFSAFAPNALVYVGLWTIVQTAAAALIGGLLWTMVGKRAWTWALAPQLALFGPLNFDLLAIAALVLALRWDRTRAPVRAVAALAAGTAAKLFPAAALPVILLRQPFVGTRTTAMRVALFGALLAACYAPAAGARFTSLESIGRYSVGIGANFDSVWGLVAAGLTGLGVSADLPLLAITLGGFVIIYVRVVLPAARSTHERALPVALAVLALLLCSRLYSPQFSLWAIPLFALVALPRRALVLLTVADICVFLTVYPLTLVDRPSDDPVSAALLLTLAAAVVLRHAALVIAWLAACELVRTRPANEGSIAA